MDSLPGGGFCSALDRPGCGLCFALNAMRAPNDWWAQLNPLAPRWSANSGRPVCWATNQSEIAIPSSAIEKGRKLRVQFEDGDALTVRRSVIRHCKERERTKCGYLFRYRDRHRQIKWAKCRFFWHRDPVANAQNDWIVWRVRRQFYVQANNWFWRGVFLSIFARWLCRVKLSSKVL